MTRAVVAFAFLCAVFGTTFGAIAIGIDDGWPPLLAAGSRFTLAGALVLGFAACGGNVRPIGRAELRGIVAIGLTVTTGTFAALYCAERTIPSGLAAVLSATSPLFAVGLAFVGSRRRLDRVAIGGLAVATLGVVLVAGVGALSGPGAIVASGAIVLSELGYAWGFSQARGVSRTVPMLQLAGAQQLVGGCALLALSAPGVLALVYLVVVASACAHTVSIWLASVAGATFASSWTYVSPFVALLVGAIAIHEPIGALAWVGGALVVAGAFALDRERFRTYAVRA